MKQRAEQGRGFVRNMGTATALVLLLAAGVSCGNHDKRADPPAPGVAEQNHPTAEELAAQEGGTVSAYPAPYAGLAADAQYCRENGGEITALSTVYHDVSVTCRVGDIAFTLGGFASEEDVNFSYDELCKAAGGVTVGVAAEPGTDFNVPACHIDTLG